jgi:hypothetical protein
LRTATSRPPRRRISQSGRMPGCAPPGASHEWSAGWRTATLDLELGDYIKRTIFNFEKQRRIEHYRLITERTGPKVEV